MLSYVLGFCFDDGLGRVVLIRKDKPGVPVGINGVGGKVEPNETTHEAMVREFAEETGVTTSIDDWHPFLRMFEEGPEPSWGIHCFRMESSEAYDAVITTTDEEVVRRHVSMVPFYDGPYVPNLGWVLAMAHDWRPGSSPNSVVAYYPRGSQ